LASDAFEEKHKIDWTQARILPFGPNPTYWRCKETAHMLGSSYPITHQFLDISSLIHPSREGTKMLLRLGLFFFSLISTYFVLVPTFTNRR